MPIIIKHLSASETNEALVHLFEPYGEIEVYQLGQDVGVELKNGDNTAEQNAVNELQNVEFEGHPLELELVEGFPDVSFPVDPDPPSGGSSSSGGSK